MFKQSDLGQATLTLHEGVSGCYQKITILSSQTILRIHEILYRKHLTHRLAPGRPLSQVLVIFSLLSNYPRVLLAILGRWGGAGSLPATWAPGPGCFWNLGQSFPHHVGVLSWKEKEPHVCPAPTWCWHTWPHLLSPLWREMRWSASMIREL